MMTQDGQNVVDITALDRARLTRALVLHGDRAGTGRYRIAGGREAHWVDLYTDGHPRCDCGDYLWRGTTCKHILAALLREGNEQVLQAVGELVVSLHAA